jgi:hypothetical protein
MKARRAHIAAGTWICVGQQQSIKCSCGQRFAANTGPVACVSCRLVHQLGPKDRFARGAFNRDANAAPRGIPDLIPASECAAKAASAREAIAKETQRRTSALIREKGHK